MVGTRVARVPVTGRFVGDGTPGTAPRASAETSGAAAGDAHGRSARSGDDSLLRRQVLAFARTRNPGRVDRPSGDQRQPRDGDHLRGRRRGAAADPFLRRSLGARVGTRSSAGWDSGGRLGRRHSRVHPVSVSRRRVHPARARVARPGRLGRAGDRDRAVAGEGRIPARRRARARRLRSCARLARNARAHLFRHAAGSVLHAPRRKRRRGAHGRLSRRPRPLADHLSRWRAVVLRSSRPRPRCRLDAPIEEARCRPTSCCPT